MLLFIYQPIHYSRHRAFGFYVCLYDTYSERVALSYTCFGF